MSKREQTMPEWWYVAWYVGASVIKVYAAHRVYKAAFPEGWRKVGWKRRALFSLALQLYAGAEVSLAWIKEEREWDRHLARKLVEKINEYGGIETVVELSRRVKDHG